MAEAKTAIKAQAVVEGSIDIKFSKKANMWLVRKAYGQKGVSNKVYFCVSREEAEQQARTI